MKNFSSIFSTLVMIAASATTQAITINPDDTVSGIIAADIMSGTSPGVFYDWSSTNSSETRDPATSITDDALVTTYAFSIDDAAYVDLGFSTSIYNGAGDDLAFFMTGNPALMDFSALVSNDSGNILISDDSTYSANTAYNVQHVNDLLIRGNLIALNMILIDLNDYGADVFGANPLTNIRFNFGSDFGSPGLSLAGGIHDTAAVVPLPLPIILFGSGLGLLGFLGHRNKAQEKKS